jgi:lipoprotein NlpD
MRISFLGRFFTSFTNVVIDVFILVFLFNIIGCSTQKKNYAPVWGENKSTKRPINKTVVEESLKPIKPIKPVQLNGEKFYVVKPGDTLYSIGFSSGLGYQYLAILNKMTPPYELSIGKKIKLLASEQQQKKGDITQEKILKTSKNRNSSHKPSIVGRSSSQKKATNSNDNKKLIKFNCEWPIEGKVVKNFSQTGRKGIDIKGKVGQKVRSAAKGKVVYSGSSLKGYGNLLIIKHNDLYLTAYANNRRLLVKEGQSVNKGQAIAEIGGEDNHKTSLHFEIRKNGSPVNPLSYLPGK